MKIWGAETEIKPRHRREIYEDVVSLSRPGGSYYVMVALSTVIASYGLIIDSAAVVIGAMLVAPLMGPIFGTALAMASGSRRLLWTSFISEFWGVLLAIAVAVVIGLWPLRIPLGAEWLVRTQPTLYDLAIALASGFAGAYAIIDERMSPALPGVAVAVAVLPPLSACGLAISTARWEMAIGAITLFVANFFAIHIASAIVFSMFGMLRVVEARRREPLDEKIGLIQFARRFWPSLLVFAIVGIFLTRTLVGLIVDKRLSSAIEGALREEITQVAGAELDSFTFERACDELDVTATVLVPSAFGSAQVAEMEQAIEQRLDREVHLVVRSLIARDVDRTGRAFMSASEQASAQEEATRREFLNAVSRIVSSKLDDEAGEELVDLRRDQPDGIPEITAVIESPRDITPRRVREIQDALSEQLEPMKLTVRRIAVMEASAEELPAERVLPAEEERAEWLSRKAEEVISAWLEANKPGSTIRGISTTRTDGRELVTAEVLTPSPVTAEQAAEIEGRLRFETGSEIDLSIRYVLGGRIEPELTS